MRDIQLLDGRAVADTWWGELVGACGRGLAAAQAVANRHRGTLDDARADELGVRLIELLDLDGEPLGPLVALASTAEVFAGPRTIAAAGRALRRDLGEATWKLEAAFAVLTRHRGLEAAVQARLCSRDAREVEVLVRAHHLYRGWTSAMLDLLGAVHADTPREDMERYLALNLQDAMVWGTRFRGRELTDAARTPLRACLSRLIWGTYQRGRLDRLFRVDPEEDGFLDADAEPFELDPNAQIGVPHRAEMAPEQLDAPASNDFDLIAQSSPGPAHHFRRGHLDAWGATFADFEIVGLFVQIDRELVPPEPRFPYQTIDRAASEREVLHALHSAGWTRRPGHHVFQYPLRGASLMLQTSFDGGEQRTLESFVYRPASASGIGPDATISYSEALGAAIRILDTFAPDLV